MAVLRFSGGSLVHISSIVGKLMFGNGFIVTANKDVSSGHVIVVPGGGVLEQCMRTFRYY